MYRLSVRARFATSWMFIIATIIFSQIPFDKDRSQPKNDAKRNQPAFSFARDLPIQFSGKFAIGMQSLIKNQPAMAERTRQVADSFRKNIKTNKHLAAIPVLAELSGRDAALLELKRISENPTFDGRIQDIQLLQQLYQNGTASLNTQQRDTLLGYGWYGKLALIFDKPESDRERQAFLRSASRMAILFILFILGFPVLFLAGLILLIVGIVLHLKGKLPMRLTLPEISEIFLLESFAIYLTGFLMLPQLSSLLFPGIRTISIAVSLGAVLASILWLFFRKANRTNFRKTLGWHTGRGILREIGAGILGYCAGLPLIFGAALLVSVFTRQSGKAIIHPLVTATSNGSISLLIAGLMACVWAPVVEETFFRGALFSCLRRQLSWLASGALSALIFAIIHPQGWHAVPVLTVIGFNLSVIREWRGSLIASMSAHALNNGSVLLLLILILK